MSITPARIAKAERYEEDEQWREAVDAWRALAHEEGDWRFLVRAAQAAVDGGLIAEGEQLFREAIGRDPELAHGYFGLGMLLFDQERMEEAQRVLLEGLRREENQVILNFLGIAQRHLGDLEASRATLQRSVELNPGDDEVYYALGLTEVKSDPLRAMEHFRRALELDPHAPHVHRELGKALWKLGKNDEAEAVVRQALGEDPADAWAHDYLGHLLSLREDWQGAQRAFLAATAHEPDRAMFWRHLADATVMLGERAEAERCYLKALSLGVDDAMANERYGVFLKNSGKGDRARTYLRRALELNPNLRHAREVLRELGDVQ